MAEAGSTNGRRAPTSALAPPRAPVVTLPLMDSTQAPPDARVPTRVVIYSICGVWLCYFALATLRGVIVGFELSGPYLWRRLAVTVASIAVTGALWPLLRLLDARPLWIKACATLIGALPAALLLAAINQWAFADVDAKMVAAQHHGETQAKHQAVRIRSDDEGNILVDVGGQPPAPPAPPAPPVAGRSSSTPAAPMVPHIVASGRHSVTIVTNDGDSTSTTNEVDESAPESSHMAMLSDLASGRYFLLLAWAALYLALVNAEQARSAERREGEYRRAAEGSELRSLRYQVNPHFLFNTLNSLSAQVMTGRLDDAEAMIQTLSTFYRRTLSGDPTGDLTLASEVELQQLYLDIEAVRFPSRLVRVIDLPDALGTAMVPGMILQPLVENSVKYAVAASTGAVTITIAAREEAGRLVLTIADSGSSSGASGTDGGGSSVAGPPRSGCGIGLANVRDRLDARFGDEASLDAGTVAGGGYRTVITMPLIREPQAAGSQPDAAQASRTHGRAA